MAETFPITLQDKLNSGSFSYNLGETKIRSETEIGPAKMRRRVTRAIDTLSASIDLEFDDWQTLKDFHDTTLDGGVNTFEYVHPFTQVTATFRFVSAPSLSPMGGRMFKVNMQWEQVDE